MTQGLIVALDLPSRESRKIVRVLGDAVDFYKVPPAISLEDPSFIPWLTRRGKRIFLDCKWHDIPSQVKRSVTAAGQMGLTSITVHTGGGRRMMEAALSVSPRPLVWGVTVLTSLTTPDLREVGVSGSARRQVLRLARLSQSLGLDGLVCSPLEVAFLRAEGISLPLITPGITYGGREGADQRRTATPAQAWGAGANLLVVGRSVLESQNPSATVKAILDEKRSSFRKPE